MSVAVSFSDLGTIDYKQAWDQQKDLFNQALNIKSEAKKNSFVSHLPQNHLLFCEHNPVYTLGKSGSVDNLLINKEHLSKLGIDFYKIDRGGDITFHGPGQITGYPILDLEQFKTDLSWYLRSLEEVFIQTLDHYGIKAGRIKAYTGVWLDGDHPVKARKICALGVKASRWVTMHGFAFNVSPNLMYYQHIVACGIENKSVTSLSKELNQHIDIEEVKTLVLKKFALIFGMDFKPKQP